MPTDSGILISITMTCKSSADVKGKKRIHRKPISEKGYMSLVFISLKFFKLFLIKLFF